MEDVRFHIGRTAVGQARIDQAPPKAHINWREGNQRVGADYDERELEAAIARRAAAGRDTSAHRAALAALLRAA